MAPTHTCESCGTYSVASDVECRGGLCLECWDRQYDYFRQGLAIMKNAIDAMSRFNDDLYEQISQVTLLSDRLNRLSRRLPLERHEPVSSDTCAETAPLPPP